MLKKLALAVMMVCGISMAQQTTGVIVPGTVTPSASQPALEPGQIYSTGNLVVPTTTTTGSTWVNGVYQDQLTCFAWGDSGYCGPNPIVRPGGNINFSFGWTDLYQQRAIASVLPGSGTGLRVNGYNFGFTAKNGNGWDDGRTDLLFAYVQFNSPSGATLLNNTNNLNYKFDWSRFEYNRTFDTPFAAQDIGTVRYGFVGRDNNGWAGPYGPEIRDVSFSLKYSVDPCKTDPLYSPTCPGYMEALAKLLPPAPVVDTTASTITEAPAAVSTTATDPLASPTATATSTPTSSSAASTPAPVAGREQSGSARTDNSLALSIISRNQQREQSIAAQAVQTAISTANDSSRASQQEAAAVAAAAVVNSTAAGSSGSGTAGGVGIRLGSVSASINSSASIDLSAGPESVSRLGNMLTDRTNPLNEYIDPRPPLSTNISTTGPVVNRNAADNEAAGGVDLAKMAVAPVGYNDYLTLALRDAAFYAPREVYRNQRTVDNVRALRQLSSDRLHQDMVEQQYRR